MIPRTYGVSPRRRNVLIGTWLLAALPLALAGAVTTEPALLIAAAIVTGVMVPLFVLALRSARLQVSDRGIELRQLGWRVATAWDNIAGVRMARGREGLVLHQPLGGSGAETLAAAARVTYGGAPFYDAEQQRLIAEGRFIPIEAFAYWLEHGDLRAILSARVPALAARGAFTPPADAKLPRRKVVLISAIIGAALLVGIALAVAPPATQARWAWILIAPAALALAGYAVVNGVAAARALRGRQYGWFALWTAAALIQLLLALAIFGSWLAF